MECTTTDELTRVMRPDSVGTLADCSMVVLPAEAAAATAAAAAAAAAAVSVRDFERRFESMTAVP